MTAFRVPTAFPVAAALTIFLAAACGPDDSSGDREATITITRPKAGSLVTENRFRVRGEARGVDAVDVNGKTAEVVGGKWNALLEFDQGSVSVTARGDGARASVDFTVDSFAPNLTLTSPDRATYVATSKRSTVEIAGKVDDSGTGVRVVSVQNAVADVDKDGTFAKTIELDEGLNVIEVSALDEADNEAAAIRGVVHGTFVDPTGRIEPGFSMKAGTGAIDTTEAVVEDLLTPMRITEVVRKQVDNENFDVTKVDYRTLDVEATPKSGKIAVNIGVEKLVLEGDATFNNETYPIVVTIDEASIISDVIVSVDADNEIDIELKDSKLNLDEQDFHFALRDKQGQKSEIDVDTLRKVAVNVAKEAFSNLLQSGLFEELYDPAVLKRRIEILGRTIVFEVVPLSIRTRSDGIFVDMAVEMPADRFDEVDAAPGALSRELGKWNIPGIESDLRIRSNRTAIERIAHGAWRSGLLHQTLAKDDLAGYELPVELNAGALAFAVDGRITNLAPDDAPALVRLRPLLPPFARFESSAGGAGSVHLRVGEWMVDILVEDEGGKEVLVASVAAFVDAEVGVDVDGIELELSFDATARADLAAEPQIDFEDEKMEDLVTGLMKAVPAFVGDELTLDGKQDFQWVTLDNPRLRVHGERDDRVSLFLDTAASEN